MDEAEIAAWHDKFPQAYDRDEYLGLYADVHGTPEEPYNHYIQELARNGLGEGRASRVGDGDGCAAHRAPRWADIQILTGQLATRPLADEDDVGTELVIGPGAKRPLRLKVPLFVSDMSFGA